MISTKGTARSEGSSPRWRGKRFSFLSSHAFLRLIPALAGKTVGEEAVLGVRGAHPRAGGENFTHVSRWVDVVGLIPALAGKTPHAYQCMPGRRAHPRAGGENIFPLSRARRTRGSSPRWRGKPHLEGVVEVSEGLIPALAGKTGGGAASKI